MKTIIRGLRLGVSGLLIGMVFWVNTAQAYLYKNEEKEIYIKGKAVADVIVRAEDAVDTNPIPIQGGDVVQQRNTLMLEVQHNVGTFLGNTEFSYFLAPRLFYDSVWDIGRDVFSDDDTRRKYGLNNRDEIDEESMKGELYLAYADFRRGPLFLRVGKQAFQWGEMSTLRVLDACIPQDNQSLAVDLEEKLVPLQLIRGTYSLYNLGPIESLLLEGYWIPQSIEDEYKEQVIAGSAVLPPIGRKGVYDPTAPLTPERFHEPKNERFGFRMGFKAGELDVYLAHFRKYVDNEVVIGNIDYTSPTYFRIDKHVPTMDVTGGSFGYYSNMLDGVIRGEVAYFRDEPMVVDTGFPGGHQFHYGQASYFDLWRYGLAFDKFKMIPWLNPSYEFFFTFEWVGSQNKDYVEKIALPWLDPGNGQKLYMDKYSNIFLAVANTVWGGGRLDTTLSFIYEHNTNTILYIPKAKLMINRNLFGEISYRGTISNDYANYGFLQDRDEVTLKLYYYF